MAESHLSNDQLPGQINSFSFNKKANFNNPTSKLVNLTSWHVPKRGNMVNISNQVKLKNRISKKVRAINFDKLIKKLSDKYREMTSSNVCLTT